jgi:hypothetical protein
MLALDAFGSVPATLCDPEHIASRRTTFLVSRGQKFSDTPPQTIIVFFWREALKNDDR